MFILWIGDRISMKGIGNGVSMIIAAGIISRLPYQFTTAWQTLVDPSNSSATFNGILTFGLYIVSYLLIIVFVVFMQTAERKIPIQYTSSTVTTRKKDMTYLPLKINSASVIPVIRHHGCAAADLQNGLASSKLGQNTGNLYGNADSGQPCDLCGFDTVIHLLLYEAAGGSGKNRREPRKIRYVYPGNPSGYGDQRIC